jgi:hypothetical protein
MEVYGIYTSGDPRGLPVLMQILQSRILAAAAPQWLTPLTGRRSARATRGCRPSRAF